MSFLDVIKLAFHNLWSRKLRTALNIFGVVLACIVLVLTLAGTKGVSNGFQEMIQTSDEVRKFVIRRSWQPDIEVPEDVLRITGQMSEERRERLRNRLKKQWLQENADEVKLAAEELESLKSIEHVRDVIPRTELSCTIALDGKTEEATIVGAVRDRLAEARVLAGSFLDPTDHDAILIGEFAAFRLGYVSDQALQELVGKRVTVSIRVSGHQMAYFLDLMGEGNTAAVPEIESILALKELIDVLDSTPLSEKHKQRIREAVSAEQPKLDEPIFVEEEYVVKGIVREATDDDEWSFLQSFHVNTRSDIFMTPHRSAQIQMGMEGFESFWAAMGIVDSVDRLESVIEEIESMGFDTHSSLRIVKAIDEEITKAKLVISLLCMLIMLISAIGISNTMVVSVLERTSEFGILKALGAEDRHVLQLMLMEGALTGLLGAVVAITCSLGISQLASIIVQRYITERIGEQYNASVFSFSVGEMSLVLAIAIVVCTLAAIFPAYRAARLDPVVAMRRS